MQMLPLNCLNKNCRNEIHQPNSSNPSIFYKLDVKLLKKLMQLSRLNKPNYNYQENMCFSKPGNYEFKKSAFKFRRKKLLIQTYFVLFITKRQRQEQVQKI